MNVKQKLRDINEFVDVMQNLIAMERESRPNKTLQTAYHKKRSELFETFNEVEIEFIRYLLDVDAEWL